MLRDGLDKSHCFAQKTWRTTALIRRVMESWRAPDENKAQPKQCLQKRTTRAGQLPVRRGQEKKGFPGEREKTFS
jgi:hypothetical protein